MNWPLMRNTLVAAISGITGVPSQFVVWKGSFEEANAVVDTKITLSANSINSIGGDEERLSIVEDRTPQRLNVCGQRQWTLTVQIEAQNQEIMTARLLADLVRVRIGRTTTRVFLNTGGMSIADMLATGHKDYLAGGRQVSWAFLDVLLNCVENDVNTDLGAGNWIEEVLVESDTINDVNGDPLPSQIDLDIERGS
jgi:hypothetical protein